MRQTIVLILCLAVFAVPVYAQSLRYVFTEYYPANFLDENGKPAGFFVDIITEALTKRMGIPVRIEVFPWKRCQTLVENGKADLITTIPTPERLSYAVSTTTPMWIKRYHLYTWKGHPSASTMNIIMTIPDIARHNLSVISYLGNSWSYNNLEKSGIAVVYAPTVESMYRMLKAHRGDMIVDDPVLVDPALKSLKLEETIIMTSGIVAECSFHPLVGKKSSFSIRIGELDATLDEMWKDGTIERILESYRSR